MRCELVLAGRLPGIRALGVPALVLLVALCALCPATAWSAPKVDLLILPNGDRITGEVKDLDLGTLTFKTDDMGTLKVEWEKVAGLVAPERFEVQTSSGSRHFGSLVPAAPGRLVVSTDHGRIDLDMTSVVRMWPIGTSFLRRIDGALNVGLSYSKSSDVAQLSVSGNAAFRKPKFEASLYFDSLSTLGNAENASSRSTLSLGYQRFLPHRWLVGGFGRFDRNPELGFNFRATGGVGFGRFFMQTNRQRFSAIAGAAFSWEEPLDPPGINSVAAAAVLNYQLSIQDAPKARIDTGLMILQALAGREGVRLELNAQLSYELIKDFTVGLTLAESYDSAPPTEGAETNDTSIVFSFGWTF